MSTTTLTAPEIRRILGDTRGRSAAEIEAAQQAERAFRDTQPVRGTQCRSCPCMVFTAAEHPNGTRAWVCGKCRRPVLATDAEWQAEEKRRAKAADRIAPKRPVAKPLPPREALQAAIDDREAIAASISALQSGRSAARARTRRCRKAGLGCCGGAAQCRGAGAGALGWRCGRQREREDPCTIGDCGEIDTGRCRVRVGIGTDNGTGNSSPTH